jgi:5'-3' exonuclease
MSDLLETNEVVLIDLSSIAHPIWHMASSEPDPNFTSTKIVARVRALGGQRQCVAICCDSGRSFRKDLVASYKANRPEHEAPLMHQIELAREQLEADGFPVWAVPTFEADDIIATATARARAAELDVLIVSADKDLLQLVGPHVRAMSARDGTIFDEQAVVQKFGVRPEQMGDYLTLVGDASDNIKGAHGIGEKKAAELLQKYSSLRTLYEELSSHGSNFKPSIATTLREFEPRLEQTRKLIALRTDADIPFEQINHERVPREVATFNVEDEDMQEQAEGAAPEHPTRAADASEQPSGPTELAVRRPDEMLPPAPSEWERQLDPRSMRDARQLAKDMYDSRMFSAYGTPQAVLSTVMVGRELGLPAMASLRCVHNIEGKHSLAASLMVALVLKSGLAEYFEPISFSDKEATFETKRKGARNAVRLQHTFDMAIQAWPKSKKDWQVNFENSGWGRNPTDMLVARATARLARMVYPDLLAGLYTPEELREIRESELAA